MLFFFLDFLPFPFLEDLEDLDDEPLFNDVFPLLEDFPFEALPLLEDFLFGAATETSP